MIEKRAGQMDTIIHNRIRCKKCGEIKGIGSSFLKMMASHLKENMAAERVLLDPHQDNKRAIRAYEKVGFKIIKSLPKHEMFEGEKVDCWLMELAL